MPDYVQPTPGTPQTARSLLIVAAVWFVVVLFASCFTETQGYLFKETYVEKFQENVRLLVKKLDG